MASFSLNNVQFPPDVDPLEWLALAYGRPPGFWEKQFNDGSGGCYCLATLSSGEDEECELPFTDHAFQAFMDGFEGRPMRADYPCEQGYCESCWSHGKSLKESGEQSVEEEGKS